MAVEVAIGGRRFLVVEAFTVARDFYLTGLLEPVLRQDREAGLTVAEAAAALATAGNASRLLAGCLEEVGVSWTPAAADRLAAWLDERTDADDRRVVGELYLLAIAGFFGHAGRSSRSSPRFSPSDAVAEGLVVRARSVRGPARSASSPSSTPPATTP